MARTFQPKAGATIVVLCALCVLWALGGWQLQRLEWKTNLISRIEERMAQKPVPLPEKIENTQDWEYRRVSMAGSFLDEKRFLVKPRTHEGVNGYHLVVPFQRASGGFVLVNRGWVSDETLPKVKSQKGMVRVEGIVTLPVRSEFTPENMPDKKDWYWIDTQAMAQELDFKNVSPVVVQIEQAEAGGIPASIPVAHNLRNDHRQYAWFWFAMSGILLVIYFLYHLKGKKDGSLQAA